MSRIIVFVFLQIVFLLKSFGADFRVAMPIIVPFNPISNEINVDGYVGYQMYYPLFSVDEKGDLQSQFLDLSKTKSKSNKFDSYVFCLLPDLKFVDGTVISNVDLVASMTYFSEMYPQNLSISKIEKLGNDCVDVYLGRQTPNLFNRLMGVASTILKMSDVKKNFPVGLGPYKLDYHSNTEIRLTYVGPTKVKYDKIVFRLPQDVKKLSYKDFDDINLVPNRNLTASDIKTTKYDVPALKVYSFVLNLSELNLRKCFQERLSKGDWIKTYGLPLEAQNLFLPWRVAPWKWNIIGATNCKKPRKKVPFLVPEMYNIDSLKAELNSIKLLDWVDPVLISGKQISDWLFGGKAYVALLGFDSSSSVSSLDGDFSSYFESFFAKDNRIVSEPVVGLKELLIEGTRFDVTTKRREKIAIQAEKLLIEGAWIFPVGRKQQSFEFADSIEIFSWADRLNGVPAIWKIK